jgi:hypothetical protein
MRRKLEGKLMKTGKVLPPILIILLLGVFIQVAQAEVSVGVKTGGWARYETKTAGTEDTGEILMQIVSVQGANIVFYLTITESDGKKTPTTVNGEIGKSNLNAFIIPAYLNVGDSFQEATYITNITGTEERILGGEARQIISGPVERMNGVTVYWDRTTGLLVEASDVKLVDTNIWQVDSQLFTFLVSVGEKTYEVSAKSNSSVSDLSFIEALKELRFIVNGESGTTGFCNITIPADLIWGELSIYKDDYVITKDVDYTQSNNGTHHFLQITYNHSTHVIEIRGTEAIPEFPSFIIFPSLIVVTLVGVIIFKRKRYNRLLI